MTGKRAKVFTLNTSTFANGEKELVKEMNDFLKDKNILTIEKLDTNTYVVYWEE